MASGTFAADAMDALAEKTMVNNIGVGFMGLEEALQVLALPCVEAQTPALWQRNSGVSWKKFDNKKAHQSLRNERLPECHGS